MVEGLDISKVEFFYSKQKAGNEILYICGLGVSVGCERLSDHSTHLD